jgi:hypothetical protein
VAVARDRAAAPPAAGRRARPAAAAGAAATGTDPREAARRPALPSGAALLAAAALAVAGCAAPGSGAGSGGSSAASGLHAYVDAVEPIRLAVNRLLDDADPILEAYREHRIGGQIAQRRFGRLERRFARYAADVAAIRPVPADLRRAQAAYAHTYVLEDSYLSALTAALPARAFGELPHTADRQRAAIIAWRIRLEVLARRLGVTLPGDLQRAGRGEIAPSPEGD